MYLFGSYSNGLLDVSKGLGAFSNGLGGESKGLVLERAGLTEGGSVMSVTLLKTPRPK